MTNGVGIVVASPLEASSMGSESGDLAADGLEIMGSKLADKGSLVAKLQELETLKAEAMAKFDGDIAALKRVLSFM